MDPSKLDSSKELKIDVLNPWEHTDSGIIVTKVEPMDNLGDTAESD